MARPGAKRLTDCPECRGRFMQWPNTGTPMFCCAPCRLAAASRRFSKQVVRQCVQCGGDFKTITSPSRAAEKRDRYCSRVCSNKARMKAVTRPCVRCGCHLTVKPSDGKYHAKKYCSNQCYWQTVRESDDMRRAPRKDDNHNDVAELFEKSGFATEDMSHVGRGFPDLLVAYRGVMKLVEIKNRKTSYGRRGLNDLQRGLQARFNVCVISSTDEALEFIGLMKGCKTELEMHSLTYPQRAA